MAAFEISAEENRALASGSLFSATRDLTPAGPTPPSPPCEAERDLRSIHETREKARNRKGSEIAAGHRPHGRRVSRHVGEGSCERYPERADLLLGKTDKEGEKVNRGITKFELRFSEKIDAGRIFLVESYRTVCSVSIYRKKMTE